MIGCEEGGGEEKVTENMVTKENGGDVWGARTTSLCGVWWC